MLVVYTVFFQMHCKHAFSRPTVFFLADCMENIINNNTAAAADMMMMAAVVMMVRVVVMVIVMGDGLSNFVFLRFLWK